MRQAVWQFLRIPPEIREEFWQNSLQKNRLSLLVICIMIFGMELYNMARVLFLSSSGLGTLNNRIYFGMYCSLLLAAALSLALQQLTRRASSGVQWAVQYVSVLFFFLWHICLNAYDLSRSPGGATITFLTAVLGLAVFIQMPARYSIPCYGGGWALFLLLTRRWMLPLLLTPRRAMHQRARLRKPSRLLMWPIRMRDRLSRAARPSVSR